MAFRFSLAAVFNLRKSIERQEYLNLERIHQEIAKVQTQLAEAEQQKLGIQQSRDVQLTESMPSVFLQNLYEQVYALEKHMESLNALLVELAKKKDQQIKVYTEARQKREVLESLREKQHAAYVLEDNKRQQTLMDDLYLARLKRK
jgi:flagellar export protein FliJ